MYSHTSLSSVALDPDNTKSQAADDLPQLVIDAKLNNGFSPIGSTPC